MNIYTKMLEFFMENGVVLNKEQILGLHDLCETIADDQRIEVLEESSTELTHFLKAYKTAVQHMLKYQYNQKAQTTKWVNTIRQQTGLMRDVYNDKSEWNKIKDIIMYDTKRIEKQYRDAVIDALGEGNNCEFPKTIPQNMTIFFLLDEENVEQFLQDYKYTDSVVNQLGGYGEYYKKNKKGRR